MENFNYRRKYESWICESLHCGPKRKSPISEDERDQGEKLYIEKISGKNTEGRLELKNMLEFIREGDTVYVHDFSRLARSTKDLLHITDLLAKKVTFSLI